ncbi:MAG: AsmA family protein [Ahrensia sp.]|nr:AsmA family protein [Ahrensia sp.]
MRLFVVIGGLIVAVLLTALIAPYFIDWTSYRDRFEAEASRILGQEVRVAGTASARLLPFPSVTFSDVRVGPVGAANITIEEFSMDAELAPFLSGEVLIFDMRLVSPVVRLDLDDEGRPLWQWPSQAPVDPAQISLENAQFVDGTLILRDRQENRQWDFTSLNGTAAAQSLFGPWRFQTEGLVRGLPFDARLSTGNLDRDGFGVRVQATLPTQQIEITTDGRVAPPDADISSWYSGTFTLKPTGENASPYLAEGVFEADARSVTVDQFRADFGDQADPYTINGSARIVGGENPRFDFSAKGNQVTLANDADNGVPIALNERLSQIGAVLASLPLPPIAGNIDLDLPTVVVGQTTIRDVIIKAEPVGDNVDQWRLRSLSANLPGRTVVEGNGILTLGADNGFKGKLVVASKQPSGLASWLTNQIDDAIRLLPNAGFQADVSLSASEQRFENVDLILGNIALKGELKRASTAGTTPTIDLALTGNNADFGTLNTLRSTFMGTDGSFGFADHDVDVDLKLENSVVDGVKIGLLDTSLRIRGDRTEFDRLSLSDVFGASISATGTLINNRQGERAGQTINFDGSVLAGDGATFLIGLADKVPFVPGVQNIATSAKRDADAFGDLALNVVGSALLPNKGNIEGSASISGALGGSKISVATTAQGDRAQIDGMVGSLMGTLENAETSVLLSQIGLQVIPIRTLGAGQLRINMSGGLQDGISFDYALETSDTKLGTAGIIKTEQGEPRYSGTARASTEDAEPWFEIFGYIFPATGLGTPLNLDALVSYQDGAYVLSELKGDIADNKFVGTMNFADLTEKPKLEGTLRLDGLDAGILTSVLTGRYDLTDPTTLFAAPLYADHSLDVALETLQFETGQGVIENAKMRLVYRDGSLSLRGFSGEAAGGSIVGDIEAQNSGGTLLVNGQLALRDANLVALVPILPDDVQANGNLSLTFTGAGKSTDGLLGALSGSGTINAKNVKVPRINANAIAPILVLADEIGYEITDSQINDIANKQFTAGSLDIAAIEAPIGLAAGILSARNVSIVLQGLGITANAAYQLASGTTAGEARLAYDAGDASVAGARPDVGLSFEQTDRLAPIAVKRDYQLMAAFVRQRALEREQARVEALQARLLEKQRLRREVRYLRYLEQERLEAERLEAARLEAERLEAERLAQVELENQRKLEEQRLAELAAQEQEAAEAAEAERLRVQQVEEEQTRARLEAARIEKERQVEEARIAREKLAAEKKAAANAIVIPRADVDVDQRGGSRGNAIDESLLKDPLAPIPSGKRIFENFKLELGN